MDLNAILSAVGKMFPSVNLNGAVQKAQQALQGTPDTLDGVSAVARSMGIDSQTVENIYQRYGQSMQAKMICKMMGTTPEAIKADADNILGASSSPKTNAPTFTGESKKFPRLK